MKVLCIWVGGFLPRTPGWVGPANQPPPPPRDKHISGQVPAGRHAVTGVEATWPSVNAFALMRFKNKGAARKLMGGGG